jgi:hypothetical protein
MLETVEVRKGVEDADQQKCSPRRQRQTAGSVKAHELEELCLELAH